MQRSHVIIGAYNLMPEGIEEAALEEAYQFCWRPFLSVLYRFPALSAVLHYSGTVLRWLGAKHPEFIMLLEEMATRKQIELLGGGYFAPLLPLIPSPDRLGQIELLTTQIRRSFAKRPRGCWLADYAWEPSLASTLQACGFDYTFLPERHFRVAGLPGSDIGSPAMTEDQGRSLVVFPAFDALESLPAPRPFAEAVDSLASRLGEQRLYSILYPGDSFKGMWEASRLESPDLFFEHSFAQLQREGLEYETTTPSRYLKGARDYRRAYFPGCASARLMERSAPEAPVDDASRPRKSPKPAPRVPEDRISAFEGSLRRVLLKREESIALYSKMQYVRILVGQLRGDKSRKKTAQEELWKAQCGSAYWPGDGGGMARLPVRAAAYSALIEAEKITRQRGSFSPGIVSSDIDFDGAKEIIYQGADLNAYVQLRGACLAELDSIKTRTNYVNAMGSNEPGPRLLCFRDRISEKGRFGEDRGGFYDAHYARAETERPAHVAALYREDYAELGGRRRALSLRKTYSFRKGGLSVEYELTNRDPSPLSLRLSVELNLAAGMEASAVGLAGLRGHDELALDSLAECGAEGLVGLRLLNAAKEERIEARSDRPFSLSHAPLRPSLRSGEPEPARPAAGPEANGRAAAETARAAAPYQGCALLLGYDLDIPADSSQRLSITLELRS
jgi:4-alpha-glucanotransferase